MVGIPLDPFFLYSPKVPNTGDRLKPYSNIACLILILQN